MGSTIRCVPFHGAAALWFCLGWSAVAMAQMTPLNETEYCYGNTCYATLSQAEQAMRTANPQYAAYLRQKESSITPATGALHNKSIIYHVPDQEPLSLNPSVFSVDFTSNPAPAYCAASNDPVFPNRCASEAVLVQSIVASYQVAHGASSTVQASFTGSYFDPFTISSAQSGVMGSLQHSRENDPTQRRTLKIRIFNSYTLSSTSGFRRVTALAASNGTVNNTFSDALVFEGRDRLNNVTRYEYATDKSYASARYDAYGSSVERKTVTVRDAFYRVTSVQTQAKVGANYVTRQQRSFTYNSRSQVATETTTDPATSQSRTTTTSYCESSDVSGGTCPFVGLVKSVNGPRTDVADTVAYTYRVADHPSCATAPLTCPYRKGMLWKVTNALGQVTETPAYNLYGKPLSVIDPNGVVTDYEYDARGRMTARKLRGPNNGTEADDRITRIEYWPNGPVKKVTQPDGAFTTYTYDGAYRLTTITDSEGNTLTLTRNAAGDVLQEQTRDDQGALLRQVSRAYNTLGQLQSQTDAYGRSTTFTYDANGNADQATDALTRVTDSNHDPLNRLSRSLQDMNGIAAETKFSYDVLDNLTQVNDPKGLNTNYSYNGLGDLTQLQSPDTGTTTYTYDSAGNRASQTDARGVTTTYVYDALNRPTAIAYPTTALNTGFTYDTTQAACATGETFSVGRLTRIDDGSGSTVYCYDRFGQLVRKVQITNGKTFALRYVFDVAGRMTGMVYPDGAVVDYVHDAQGRVTEVGATPAGGTRQIVLDNATYYPFGPVAEWSYGNGRVMKRSLNQNYQPGFVEVVGPGGLNLGYEFDQVGNLKKLRTANQAEPPLRVYAYDGLNRLTESRDGSSNALLEGYTYDKTGNRTSATIGAATTTYAYPTASHRLDTVGSTARSYDAAGNTQQIGGTAKSFVYDDRNRMRQYLESGIVKRNYDYNGRGEQVRKWLAANDDRYSVYDEGGQWLGEYDATGAPLQQIVWLGNLPVGVLAGSGASQRLHYIEADALGTPRVVVDPTRGTLGTAVWRWELTGEAFGNAAPNQDPDGDSTAFVFDMRFPGQRYDAVSGLNYNYLRDYETENGRYVESDPIGLNGGISTYSYVNGMPLVKSDRFGLFADGDGRNSGPSGNSSECRNIGQIVIFASNRAPTLTFTLICVYDCNFSCPKKWGEIKFLPWISYNIPVCPKKWPRSFWP
jgi:RHS repeat-associated protein